MSGTRRSRKQSTRRVIPKEGKEETFQSRNSGRYSAKAAVREAKLDIKSKKLMAEAKLAAKKKIAAEKKRQEFAKKKKDLMKAAKKKGLKLRTDYTALYRKPKT
jgi:Arc/MetJ-type ribon-helix-helix transcriptional regulator